MKKFFKKLVGKDKNGQPAAMEEQKQAAAEQAMPAAPVDNRPPCHGDYHREPALKCFNDVCMNKICTACASKPNANNEILCQMCTLSAQMLDGGMDFDDSEEELKDVEGKGMDRIAHVSFDQHSSQVVGWDSIWAIIDGEDQMKAQLQQKLEASVIDYQNKRNSRQTDQSTIDSAQAASEVEASTAPEQPIE